MNARVFANTTSLSLTADLEGAEFVPPVIPAGQDIYLTFRPSREIEGTGTPDDRAIRAVSLRLGRPGLPPEQGTYQLTIAVGATEAETASIAYDATPTQIAAAINAAIATPLSSLNPCTVTEHLDGLRIVFADQTAQPEVTCTDNALWPISFVEIDAIEFDEGWAYMLDLRQAPVAEAAGAYTMVPDAPSISEMQVGGDFDGIFRNAIQKLTLPAEFAGGSYLLKRGGVKSSPSPSPSTLDQVDAMLRQIADTGGTFVTTQVSGGVYIEFQGSMAGQDQDLIEVEVFESPGSQYLVTLSTATAGVRELLRNADAAGRVECPMDLDFEIAHPSLEDVWERKVISVPVTLGRPVSDGTRNASAEVVWDQPLSRGDYKRHSTNALLIGNRGMRFLIGDGSATSFALAHNLVENPRTITANASTNKLSAAGHNYQNLDPITFSTSGTLPAPLDATKTYFVLNASTDDYQVSLTPNGAAVDLTNTGSGTHTSRLKDGTVEGVSVEVWQTGGSQLRMAHSAYQVAKTSLDVVTVSGFASTPTANQYEVFVQTIGRPATYQSHQHGIDDTPEAKARIEALEARVTALEASAGNLGAINAATLSSGMLSRPLRPFFALPGSSLMPAEPPAQLYGWKPFAADGASLRPVFLRPAVHLVAASVETLPTPLPRPSSSLVGRVFTTATARADFPGGGLLAGDHAACDGRGWYRVARIGSETTWYPQVYEIELFRFAVSEDEMVASSVLDLSLGVEAAIYSPEKKSRTRRTGMQWTFEIQHGVPTSDSSPATTGSNLDTYFSSATAMLRHEFRLSEEIWQGTFGIQITRPASGSITAVATKYFKPAAALSAPATGKFAIRGVLLRGDVEDLPSDPRGLIAFRGFDVGAEGQADVTLGKYSITS